MRLLILFLILLTTTTAADADFLGHQIDLVIIGNGYTVNILQEGLGNHELYLEINNSNLLEITILQSGDGPWSIKVDNTSEDWPDAVTVGGICNTNSGCSLILK
jgi:hypothetical protein